MQQPTEKEIYTAWSEQSYDQAFSLLATAYASIMYRTALRIVLEHTLAQDVVQDASLKIWRAMQTFKGKSTFSTWTYRIVVNESLSALRKKRAPNVDISQMDIGVPDSPYYSPDDILNALHQAVSQLPEKQRITFQLRYFDEKPYAEIAEILGTSIGGLKANYNLAREKVKMHVQALNPSSSFASKQIV